MPSPPAVADSLRAVGYGVSGRSRESGWSTIMRTRRVRRRCQGFAVMADDQIGYLATWGGGTWRIASRVRSSVGSGRLAAHLGCIARTWCGFRRVRVVLESHASAETPALQLCFASRTAGSSGLESVRCQNRVDYAVCDVLSWLVVYAVQRRSAAPLRILFHRRARPGPRALDGWRGGTSSNAPSGDRHFGGKDMRL
jgi:hypothetical protein